MTESPSVNFRVEVRKRPDDSYVVVVFGEVDVASAPRLEAAMPDADVIVIDLKSVTFMDSSGLHLLIRAHQHARDQGRTFALDRQLSPSVQRLLELTAMDRVFLFDELA
ncbi:STAS domain-containing protein [Baekduia soli]|uniref:Anti-sigma factor antagonist n=1 Tax=Baekduia soli TaxID=496014 RepID=A0A5B8U6G4_9ACTN|nr:STAS domain-containing protein [Baekduia soli]QEC48590.1 STAS domain-containing protein [Baekduia soli]